MGRCLCLLLLVAASWTTAKHLWAEQLVYENDFAQPEALQDWRTEGPGEPEWVPGGMILASEAHAAVYEKWLRGGRENLKAKDYYRAAEQAIGQSRPELVEKLEDETGQFVGGHIVCWNEVVELPRNYRLEYDFQPLSPIGLAIVFVNAQGPQGESIFASALKPRHGVFRSYTHGDINAYHISYWANHPVSGIRGTSNLRKDSGFYLLSSVTDPTSADLDYSQTEFEFNTYHLQLEKRGTEVRFVIDGALVLMFDDQQFNPVLNRDGTLAEEGVDTGPAIYGGKFGFRQMLSLKAKYSKVRVYEVGEEWPVKKLSPPIFVSPSNEKR